MNPCCKLLALKILSISLLLLFALDCNLSNNSWLILISSCSLLITAHPNFLTTRVILSLEWKFRTVRFSFLLPIYALFPPSLNQNFPPTVFLISNLTLASNSSTFCWVCCTLILTSLKAEIHGSLQVSCVQPYTGWL